MNSINLICIGFYINYSNFNYCIHQNIIMNSTDFDILWRDHHLTDLDFADNIALLVAKTETM